MDNFLIGFNWALFFHFAGIIIGLGAVSVIDTLGFVSRKSKEWTQTTIEAHYVTKPLIWIGVGIVFATWIFVLISEGFVGVNLWKSLILLVLVLNGCFLSFWVSPRLEKLRGKKVLLDKKLQIGIAVSMIVSFLGWWSFVFLTVWKLG